MVGVGHEKLCHLFRVPLLNCAQHDLVLAGELVRVDALQVIHDELRADLEGERFPQGQKDRVPGGLHDGPVEALILVLELHEVPPHQERSHRLQVFAKPPRALSEPGPGQARGQGFQHRFHLQGVHGFRHADLADSRPLVHHVFQHALCHELANSLPHRYGADAQLGGDPRFHDPVTGCQVTDCDHVEDVVSHLLTEGVPAGGNWAGFAHNGFNIIYHI
jgi:hypothetical protein